VTEVGLQPWIVYGYLLTEDAVLGFLAHSALSAARPADVPAILSGLSNIADRLMWWLHHRHRVEEVVG
jgi:hypothetical protein